MKQQQSKMTTPQKRVAAVEALKLLQGDADADGSVCVQDSSSEDEDLLWPDDTEDTNDLEYRPSQESEDDEEYEPEPAAPKKNPVKQLNPVVFQTPQSRRQSRPAASPRIPQHSENDEEYEPEPAAPKKKPDKRLNPVAFKTPQPPRQSRPAASPRIPKQKKRRLTQGTPSPARKKPRNGGKRPRKSDGEDRWHDKDEEDVQPDTPRFKPQRIPGPTFDTTRPWSPIELFQLFFSASVVKRIVENTNANAARRKLAGMTFKWEELTEREFNTFVAIIIFTGLVSVHHRSDYWRTTWPYNFHFPRETMSRSRFEAILWSLHISDPKEDEVNDQKRNTPEFDRLFKIKPLYTEIVNACKACFHPHQNLSIDERMVASRARISFRQYIKNKPKKWGYKLFVLADSSTGYTWNFSVYTGKKFSLTADSESLSYTAVMDLLSLPLLGSGYKLFTDNWYTSPTLFNDLFQKNIGCCGTMRRNHSGLPQTETNALPKRPKRGDLRWIRSGNLLFVKWMDTKEVPMCSSLHQAYSGRTVDRKVKEAGVWVNKALPVPDCVLDYNKNMGGVDLSNALIETYTVRHKTTKWYKTFFYHFVDIAVVNSYVLHKELFKIRQDPGQTKPLTHKTFREQLAKELLELAEDSDATPAESPSTCMPAFFESEESRIRKHCRRCIENGSPRVKTAVLCRKCNVPLCLTSKKNCFQLWHDGL